jgi:LPS-assembly protein
MPPEPSRSPIPLCRGEGRIQRQARLLAAALLILTVAGEAAAQTFDRSQTEQYYKSKSGFSFEFRGVQPGGEVKWSVAPGGTQEFVTDEYVILQGGVRITYGDVVMQADKITYNLVTKDATAEGNVVIDQGPQRLSAETAVFNLEAKTGTLNTARASLEPSIYFRGEKIEKLDEETYRLTNGVFTSCDIDDPDWSFRLAEGTIVVDDYAYLHGLSFRAGRVPIFWSPYLVWPAKEDRSRGFLIPKPGYNNDFGAYLKTAYFLPWDTWADATIHADAFSKGVIGTGVQGRYVPTPAIKGEFNGYVVFDPGDVFPEVVGRNDRWEWKYSYQHTQENLPGGFRGVIDIRDFSDLDFFQTFERDFRLNTLSNIYSSAYLTKNRPTYSLNIRADRREHFLGRTVVGDETFQQSRIFDQLPGIDFRMYPNRVAGTPLYFSLESSASHLRSINNPGFGNPEVAADYFRADLFPTLTMQVRTPPWLSVKPRVSARATQYTSSLCDRNVDPTCAAANPIVDQSLTRTYGQAEVEVVGPSFSRVFDREFGGFNRFKHVIEPRVRYLYTTDVADQDRVIRFDIVDSPAIPLVQEMVEYSVTQRILGKEAGPNGIARDLMSLRIRQSVSLGEPFSNLSPRSGSGQRFTPLVLDAHINPYQRMVVDASVTYGNISRQIDQTSLSATVTAQNSYLNLTWFASYPSPLMPFRSSQVRFGTGAPIIPNRLRADAQVNYDIERQQLLEQRYVVGYYASCYDIALEFRDFLQFQGASPQHNRDYQLSISLKNVGTFLDFRGSLDNIF